jgi:Arc/MetJ-type ribon-helix-helix transcriptional regulator
MRVTMRLNRELGGFLDGQVSEGHYASRSAAVTAALAVWRESRLQPSYTEAFALIDPLWDLVAGDGIDDEWYL